MNSSDDNILLKIYEEVKAMREQLKEIPKMKKQLEEIPKIKQQLEEIPKMKKQLEEIPEMKQQLKNIPIMQNDIKEIKQDVSNISGSVARIEIEHGEKLVALFDAFKLNTEQIEQQDKRLTKCENKILKHDDQIYVLNSKVQNI